MRDLTIIILTYNSASAIQDCLSRVNFDKYQVILIDNASSDDTVEIAKKFPVKIIQNSENIGYARANNIALKQVRTNFALVLNVDSIISDEDIETTIFAMKTNDQVAIAGPIVYGCEYLNGEIINKIKITNIKKKTGLLIKSKTKSDENFFYSQFVTGAAMFFNMNIMRKVGFFDEGFFLYCEDNEICKRVLKKGYQCGISKNSKFYHIGSKSCILNENEIYRVYWHKYGWSRPYYTSLIWGKTAGKLKAANICAKMFLICMKQLVTNGRIESANRISLSGAFSYLIGKNAFDKNGKARG